jgi:ribulose kinase
MGCPPPRSDDCPPCCRLVTYRATQHQARSANSLVCKFSYIPTDAHESAGSHPESEGWNADFLKQVGLGELVERGLGQIGGKTGEKLSVKEGSEAGEALVLTVRSRNPNQGRFSRC